jgi:hypothetical protein
MTLSFKAPAVFIAAISVALSVTGVVLASTDPNPHGYKTDPLNLHGFAPRSADIAISVSTNSLPLLSGDFQVDFHRSVGELTMGTSIMGANTQLQVVVGKNHAYLVHGGTFNRPYLELGKVGVSWYGVSFEMAHPQVSLLNAATSSVTMSHNEQGEAVYTYKLNGSSLPLGTGLKLNGATSLAVSIGRGGELTGISIKIRSKQGTETIALRVLSYNQPVNVTVPKRSEITTGNAGLGSLLKVLNISRLTSGLTTRA